MRKHLVFVANTAWSMYNFRIGLISYLVSLGHKVTVIAPIDRCSNKLRNIGADVVDIKIDNKGTNPIRDFFFFTSLHSLYRKIKPDLIFHYTIKPNIYGSLAARMVGFPCVSITTGLGYTFLNEGISAKVARFLYRWAFRYPQRIGFLNKADSDEFLSQGLVSVEKCWSLPSEGVDLNVFNTEVVTDPPSLDKNRFSFLYVGRMLWDKGIGELTDAVRILRNRGYNIVLNLLGVIDALNPKAISKGMIEQWVADGLLNYLGVTDSVVHYIATCDCAVLPSYREGTPRTLLEAAAMGKPIVTTDVPGCREVVDDGVNGFLCKVKDPVDLADKMEKMIKLTSDERHKMGRAGREKMEREFDEKIVIQKYLEVIEEITGIG